MKVFAILACVLAAAAASPSAWTLRDLSDAITNPTTDAALKPVLDGALDVVMQQLFSGVDVDYIVIRTEAGVASKYSLAQLDSAIHHSGYALQTYLEDALNEFMNLIVSGSNLETIDVHIPALELSYWSLNELDAVLTDAATSPALLPYYEQALNALVTSLFAGGYSDHIVVAIPVDIVTPAEVPNPVPAVNPVVAPEAPLAPPTAVSSSSPLVQIILNVQNPNVVDVVSPVPAIEGPVFDRPRPVPTFNPIDVLAPLPIEALEPSPVGIVGPMV